MKDFEFTVQYEGQEPLELNTHHIQEDVLRMRVGLEPHMETDDEFEILKQIAEDEFGVSIVKTNNSKTSQMLLDELKAELKVLENNHIKE